MTGSICIIGFVCVRLQTKDHGICHKRMVTSLKSQSFQSFKENPHKKKTAQKTVLFIFNAFNSIYAY